MHRKLQRKFLFMVSQKQNYENLMKILPENYDVHFSSASLPFYCPVTQSVLEKSRAFGGDRLFLKVLKDKKGLEGNSS